MDATPSPSERSAPRRTPAQGTPIDAARVRLTPAQGTPLRAAAAPVRAAQQPLRTPATGTATPAHGFNPANAARRTPARGFVPAAVSPDAELSIDRVSNADTPPWQRSVPDVTPYPRSELAARILNVTIAVIALVVLAPIFLLVALAVRLSSRGPIFYLQTRVGLDRRWNETSALYNRRTQDLGGRVFTIYKFRSMYTDAERHGKAVWATRNDPRVTPLGRVLRKTRLDEIPQLINVIKGDMNIVGPRPERPSIFVRLREDVDGYALRQRAKPGITGWAQINHSYDSCIEDVKKKVHYDLEYLQRQSVWEDVKIMVMTVPVMVFRRGGW